jgi:hypothetical protein
MNMKNIYLFLMVSLCYAQIPQWFSTHSHPKFPTSEFILGVGTGGGTTGAESAKKAALADIVSQLRVQVQSEMKTVTESFAVNDDEQIYSDFKRQSRTMVSDEITGADVIETVVDQQSATTYALVVLNREKYSASLRSELESGWKQASDFRSSAKEFASKGKLNEAIQSINQIKQVIAPLFAKQVLHNAAARSPFNSPSVFNPAALQTDIRTLLSQINVVKKGGDNQKGKIGEKFSKPFSVAVTVQGIPCAGVTVIFQLDEKNVLGQAITDDKGMASFQTTIRAAKSDGIRAILSIKDLGREFNENLVSSSVSFNWSAESSNKTFVLEILSSNKKIADALRSKLSTSISQIGYKTVTKSNNIISVEVQGGPVNQIEGMAGTLYNLTLEVLVNLKDNSSNSTLGSIKVTSKGVGISEDDAMEKAASGLKIDQNELAILLEK